MIDMQFFDGGGTLTAVLFRMDTALNPVSIAEFLGVEITPYLQERAVNRFLEEGDDASDNWEGLATATQDIRDRAGYGAAGPINVRTGELENYITKSPGGVLSDPAGATLTWPGTPAPAGSLLAQKVKVAQAGLKNPSTPARPVIAMNETDTAFVLAALGGFIIKRVSF